MEIALDGIEKTFGREVVFTGVSLVLPSGSRTAVLGSNGSGKSTLLQVIGGMLTPTAGTLTHVGAHGPIDPEVLYRHVSIAAPYMGLYDDLDLATLIALHSRFKPIRGNLSAVDLARIARLEHALGKPVAQFSSGMRQRLKLALAILSDTALLLLDEPASNLDAQGIAWYRALLEEHVGGRTLLVASNRQAAEHDLCTDSIEVERYKPAPH